MIQITWTNLSPTQIEGSVDGNVWYRLRRTSTPFHDNVWQITAHFPFPHEGHAIWFTEQDAKDAIEASLVALVSFLSGMGLALAPEPDPDPEI